LFNISLDTSQHQQFRPAIIKNTQKETAQRQTKTNANRSKLDQVKKRCKKTITSTQNSSLYNRLYNNAGMT